LPDADHPMGKVAVAVAPSDPNRVYALIQDTTPSLYRSDDAGVTWRLVNQSHLPSERSAYYTRMAVSPDDPNLLYFPSVSWSVSRDGGETLAHDIVPGGGDNHDIWIDPTNPNRILDANDGGPSVSLNRAQSYEQYILPIAQVYHVYTDSHIPYNVFGNRQDGDAYMGPSNNLTFAPILAGDWRSYGGCESGFGVPDPQDADIVWSGCYDGGLNRMDLRTGQARTVNIWPDATYGWAPKDVKYRWHWTFPIAISPFDHNKVYVGSQFVHVTTNAGQTWNVISPDLTTNDKSHQQDSGGISRDNLMTFDGAVLYAIAESPKQAGLIWTGSNDGQVNVTKDGGKTWTNVTKSIPGLPAWGTVMNVEPSPFDAGTAYIAVSLEQVGDFGTYVYKTSDFGANWKSIGGSVPKGVNASADCVREDPVRKGMLYLGTNNAIYVSWDDGGSWTRLRSNLPPAPVYWLEIEPRFHDLVVGTYGRGIYVLDDITPLRDWEKASGTALHLFVPRQTYRLRTVQSMRQSEAVHVIGENPPYGADINFYLGDAGKDPAGKDWTIEVSDGQNKLIRTMKGKAHAGLNRVWWDLSYDGAHKAHVMVPPPDATWLKNGPEGWRPLVVWGDAEQGGTSGPRVAPGHYTVKLTTGGESATAPIEVLRDPGSLGSEADLRAETTFLLQVRDEMSEVVDMINHLERTRHQVEGLPGIFGGDPATNPKEAAALKAAKDFETKAVDVEELLVDVHLTGNVEDAFRHPMMLYGKLANLESGLAGAGADLPPTDQQVAVNKELAGKIAEARERLKTFVENDTPTFNLVLKSNGFGGAIQP